MKKKIVVLGLVAALMSTTACGGNKYVKMGDYTGMHVEYTSTASEVTDEVVAERINYNLKNSFAEKAKKTYKAALGDIVNIDYKGLKDGVAFDHGTGTNYDLELGSGTFIPGFEDGLVGAKTGEKRDLDLTFPDPYVNNPDMAGQKVVFKVTVNYVSTVPTLDTITDEFVKSKVKTYTKTFGDTVEVKTVDEYKNAVKTDLQELSDLIEEDAKMRAVWDKVLDNAEAKEYPQDIMDAVKPQVEASFLEYIGQYGYDDIDKFCEDNNQSKEEYEKSVDERVKQETISRVITDLIMDKEGITLSDDEYKTELEDLAKKSGASSGSELEEKEGKNRMEASIKRQKVEKWLVEKNDFELVEQTTAPETK